MLCHTGGSRTAPYCRCPLSVSAMMLLRGSVTVHNSLLVQTVVQTVMGGFQRGAHQLEAPRLGPWGEGVDIGQGAFDLLQHRERIRLRENRLVAGQHLDRAGVRCDIAG